MSDTEKLILEPSGPLKGTVEAGGAKNAALPIMAASLLTDDESVIDGVPHVTDVESMIKILHVLGLDASWDGARLHLKPNTFSEWTAPHELVSLMRASICVLGPLLARHGRAKVAMPGGCIIGPRPVDLHLKGLEALGATFTVEHGYIIGHAERLRGTTVHLSGPFGSSVLGTDNVMMAATLADGVTIIENAACEPEVADLANFLIAMGANITGQGTPRIVIEGKVKLHGAHHRIIRDRIEAGTLMIAAAMLGGDVTVKGAVTEYLGALFDTLVASGVMLDASNGSVRVRSDRKLKAVRVTTLPFPGFPTDLQAQMMAMMTVSVGVSLVTEKIYPERFMHVEELRRMGAQITREGPSAIVQGVNRLSGAPVAASDLRASAALVLAGLAADTETEMTGVEHLDRGYEHLEIKLSQLGAAIRRERG